MAHRPYPSADDVIWDAHSGFMPDPAADLNNLAVWREAGVDYLSIDVGFDLLPWTRTVETIAAFRHWLLARPEHYALVASVAEIRQAKAAGKLAVNFDIEGMNALNGRVEMVEFYHRLGVRQMLFAYNRSNLAGGGCHDADTGLTAFGREVIDEMNRLGMFVDLTHTGHRTTLEVMDYSPRPVIFSHSNPRALCDHGRNITDDQILGCARSGGIVGVVGLSRFMGGTTDAERLADHVGYLIDLAGPRHVGVGLDYAFPVEVEGIDRIIQDNPQFWPESEYGGAEVTAYVPPSEMAVLAEVLLRRGYSDAVVRGVMGGNFMRLAEEIWT